MKKGFTLVELLAVIAILAIIALIAVPRINNTILTSKEGSYIRSAEIYGRNVETKIANEQLNNPAYNPTNCIVNSNGTVTCDSVILNISKESTSPKNGNIILSNGEIQDGSTLVFDDTTVKYKDGKWSIHESLSTPPDNCFTTKLWEGDELKEFNDTFYSNYTTPVVTITGYTCGNSFKSYDSSLPNLFTYNNDGKYTKISIPKELPVVNVETVTYRKDICENVYGEGNSVCASQDAFLTEIGKTEDQLKGKGSINDIVSSEHTPFFNFTTNISDTKKYPVVGIIGLVVGVDEVEMGDNIEILHQSFAYNNWSEVTLPPSLKYLGLATYAVNPNLKEIVIPNGTKYIIQPFNEDKLEKVSILGNVELIYEGSFYNQNISQLYLGEGIKVIEEGAFDKNKLETVTIPSSVESLYNVFSNNQLKEMIIEGKCSSSDFKKFNMFSNSWADGYGEENIIWKGTNCK